MKDFYSVTIEHWEEYERDCVFIAKHVHKQSIY